MSHNSQTLGQPNRQHESMRRGTYRQLASQEDFQAAAVRERVRVHRNNSQLALILLDYGDRIVADSLASLSDCLELRLSPVDMAGFTNDGRIGVLLPDLAMDRVTEIADEIQEVCGKHATVRCEVLVFPHGSNRGSRQERVDDGERQSGELRALDRLLAAPMPIWKRAIDIGVALTGLLLAMPVILVAGLLIKLTSHGSMFYRQRRTGHGGREFHILKLRTMFMNAESLVDNLRHKSDRDGPAFKLRNDPRILPVGRVLRKLSIDELPQLWNVLVGEMSLVGPRPLPVDETKELADWHRERLRLKPGITGPWQVSGRNDVTFENWMRMDVDYVRNVSLRRDLMILAQTVPAVLFCRGAS